MKKKQIMLGLACFAALNVGNYVFASDNPFATVPQSTGYYQDVASLVHDGLIDGYGDKDFSAARPLTRVEMAVFTAKAMSNSAKAGVDDTQRIQRLTKEFTEELSELHVKVPGVATAQSVAVTPAAKKPALDLCGEIRFRYDYMTHENNLGKTKDPGAKNATNYYEINAKADFGSGWGGKMTFLGTRNRDGEDRSGQENTNGQFDMSRSYVYGPLAGGRIQIGRDKAGEIRSMVNNQYYQGVKYTFGKAAKTNLIYAKPDYAITDGDRGVKATKLNPKDEGIEYVQLDTKYPVNERTNLYGGYYRTWSNKASSYKSTNIYEGAFDYSLSKKLLFAADYARSDQDNDNTGWNLGLSYGTANKTIRHSWNVFADYVHLERNSYIKTSFDINDSDNGAQGWDIGVKYIPIKNVMWTTRWLQYNTLLPKSASAGKCTTKFFRTQVEYFF